MPTVTTVNKRGGGLAIGPLFASGFYYLGGYAMPFIICGIIMFICASFIPKLEIQQEEDYLEYSMMFILREYVIKVDHIGSFNGFFNACNRYDRKYLFPPSIIKSFA